MSRCHFGGDIQDTMTDERRSEQSRSIRRTMGHGFGVGALSSSNEGQPYGDLAVAVLGRRDSLLSR
jgi:hypothetical protein